MAAAVLLPHQIDFDRDPWLREIQDSKKLSSELRERLAPLIQGWALSSAIRCATVEEIDRLNIFHASHLAMVRALEGLSPQPHHALIDGKFLPKQGLPVGCKATAVIKGDQLSLSIAAASIIAKVWRDHHMVKLDEEFPGYGLSKHKGYPTPIHTQALNKKGVTSIHRRSFKPVAALV